MPIFVGAATSTFLSAGGAKGVGVGIGTTDTTGRNAGINTARGTLIYNATDQQLQVYEGNQWVGGLTTPFSATGGTLDTTTFTGYKVHIFTSPGSLVVDSGSKSANVLLVGGGGGGGGSYGGGGGGGAYISTSMTLVTGTYPIQIGSGGVAGSDGGLPYYPPSPGAYQPGYAIGLIGTGTTFGQGTPLSISAPGGGGGGARATGGGPSPGGSGGGAGDGFPTGGLPGGTAGAYGNNGGAGAPEHSLSGAGGGGAGQSGGASVFSPRTGGIGGRGSNEFTYAPPSYGTPGPSPGRYFAGGGGGGTYSAGTIGPGGSGGGGNGGGPAPQTAVSGTVNTGGGGGGGPDVGPISGGSGGSGIVIIAYPTS